MAGLPTQLSESHDHASPIITTKNLLIKQLINWPITSHLDCQLYAFLIAKTMSHSVIREELFKSNAQHGMLKNSYLYAHIPLYAKSISMNMHN
jgi:hypothetical protein